MMHQITNGDSQVKYQNFSVSDPDRVLKNLVKKEAKRRGMKEGEIVRRAILAALGGTFGAPKDVPVSAVEA